MTSRPLASAVLALALLALPACGDDASSADDATVPTASAPQPQECEERTGPATAPAGVSTDLATKPEVTASDEAPSCDLVVVDVVEGTGAEATPPAQAEVKYVGAFYDTGEEFDSSWSRGADTTLPVPLGGGGVIPGFEQGVTGMKVGGRRYVVIPPDLGYGEQGSGPIPGGATLVFVIDLVEVVPPEGRPPTPAG